MTAPHLRAGRRAEDIAETYLTARGLVTLARNHRCRGGEIDLVMRDGATLVFVEVRARASAAYGGAAASITAAKRHRVVLAARHYLAAGGIDAPCRFDVVLLQSGRVEWLRAAFEA
jgi:putative endonuclease